ncbi:MAG: glycosyltransferase family 39 protein, partial [Elusimicrobia bacterium]|nr:glycosyltransferase family 39 protein [Elusimicrobiota bacterium]
MRKNDPSKMGHPLFLIPLLILLVLGCFLRLKNAHDADSFNGSNYYALGLNLKTEGIFAYPTNPKLPTAYRSPLYPAFLALFVPRETSHFPHRILYAQAILGSIAIASLYVLGSAAYHPAAGLFSAAWYALDPEQTRLCASLEIEFFFSLLLLAIACGLVYCSLQHSLYSYLGLSFLIGVSLTCRSTLFLYPLFLGIMHRHGKIGLILLSSYLVLIPWTLRNAIHFREFIPFEHHAAICNLFTASEGMVQTWLPRDAQAMAAMGD